MGRLLLDNRRWQARVRRKIRQSEDSFYSFSRAFTMNPSSVHQIMHRHGKLSHVGRISVLFFVLSLLGGCGEGRPPMATVMGKVLYRNEPLQFGSVMFQPAAGQPAVGRINTDGSFELSTYKPGDGAQIGRHKVRVTCFEGQGGSNSVSKDELALGRSLIPVRYSNFDESGIEVVVAEENLPVVIDLDG